MNVGTVLLVIGSFIVMPFLLAFICLISIEMQHIPIRLRPLKMRIDGFIDNIEGEDAGPGDAKPIPPLHAAFLANPGQDITTLMAMVQAANQVEESVRVETPAPIVLDPSVEYAMVHLEVQLYMGIILTPVDGALELTRAQYRQLREFCAFYFDEIQTPEQTFGRFGLVLRVS